MRKLHPTIWIAAAAGGTVPNLVRIAVALLQGTFQFPSLTRTLSYSLGLAMMAGAGAFMAWVFDEKEKRKAFYLGMGLPALLQLTFSNIDTTKAASPPAPVTTSQGPVWVPFAVAADSPSRPSSSSRQIHLAVQNYQGDERVTFYSKGDGDTKTVNVPAPRTTLAVPDFARSCTVGVRDLRSERVEISTAPVTVLEVAVKENNWTGFWNAVGAPRPAKGTIEIQRKEP